MFSLFWPHCNPLNQDFFIVVFVFFAAIAFVVLWFYVMYKLIVRPRPLLDKRLLAKGLTFKGYALVNIDKILIAILMSWLSPVGIALAIYFLRNDYLRLEELEEKNIRP